MHVDTVKASDDVIERIRCLADTIAEFMNSAAGNLLNLLENKIKNEEEIIEQEDLQFSAKPPKSRKVSNKFLFFL